jgi:hypothetical protein
MKILEGFLKKYLIIHSFIMNKVTKTLIIMKTHSHIIISKVLKAKIVLIRRNPQLKSNKLVKRLKMVKRSSKIN